MLIYAYFIDKFTHNQKLNLYLSSPAQTFHAAVSLNKFLYNFKA
jgi:hypothetical protein